MERELCVLSPAKINLHLDIRERRPDGYHEIISLFHLIDLRDEMTIRPLPGKGRLNLTGNFDCPPEENLIIRAARLFNRLLSRDLSWEFRVNKRIPSGAGLGGGSGNAAAALKGLNALLGEPLSGEALLKGAETLGCDVPFFLSGPACLVTGRGEILEPLRPLPGAGGWEGELVLAAPEPGVSTRAAYDLFDGAGQIREHLSPRAVREAYLNLAPRDWPFFNSFRGPLFPRYPALAAAESVFRRRGADFVSLSGSGSAVYGLFSCPAGAGEALEELKGQFPVSWKIKLLAYPAGAY
ncbi:MAG: 4-(cytidine 5'-diphospho)-2-C-methyl-D-erythritol kinase [Spirochaetales bacterium]|jgi:4-diphosphocytidyl-2-C-methyl-D-erythritol kinase|nr:4-(cytidine 5'-diphospho)-2-C-methyl-D-erythritol kinase [Spirochaetales bacterium]